jgi:putative FmdB family regulatory protein
MPIFEYICQGCNYEFEALVYGSQRAECPKCHGKKLAPQLSVFAVSSKSSHPRHLPGRAVAAATREAPEHVPCPTLINYDRRNL